MSFSRTWNELTPVGAVTPANTIDLLFRQLKVDIRERIESAGLTGWDTDDPLGFANLVMSGANPKIIGATASLRFKNLADSLTILELLDIGDVIVGRDLSVTRDLTVTRNLFTDTVTANSGSIKKLSSVYFDNGNSGAAKVIDWNSGNFQKVLQTANCAFTLSNPVAGSIYCLLIKQDVVGGWTRTWPGTVVGTLPAPSTAAFAANLSQLLFWFYDGVSYIGTLASGAY